MIAATSATGFIDGGATWALVCRGLARGSWLTAGDGMLVLISVDCMRVPGRRVDGVAVAVQAAEEGVYVNESVWRAEMFSWGSLKGDSTISRFNGNFVEK